MGENNKRRAVLICASLAAAVGVIKATVAAITDAVKYYDPSVRWYIAIKDFLQAWLSEWVFPIFLDNILWVLPLIGLCILVVFLIEHICSKATKKWSCEKKRKIQKVLFMLSFVPIGLILIYSVYSMFAGMEIGFWMSYTTYYGFEGFLYSFIIYVFAFTVIPILPFMLVWQIFYLVRRKSGK